MGLAGPFPTYGMEKITKNQRNHAKETHEPRKALVAPSITAAKSLFPGEMGILLEDR